jgi:hypothetical protein
MNPWDEWMMMSQADAEGCDDDEGDCEDESIETVIDEELNPLEEEEDYG